MADNEELKQLKENQKKANDENLRQTGKFFNGIIKRVGKASDVVEKDFKKAGEELGKQVSDVVGREMSGTASAITGIVKGDMDKVVGEIATQTTDILGPELSKVGSVAVGSIKSTVGIGKALLGKNEEDEEESKTDKKRNTFLKEIVTHFRKEEKRWQLEGDEGTDEGGMFGKIISVGALLVGIVVGYTIQLKRAFDPFFNAIKSITGKLKASKFGTTISNFTKSTGKILSGFKTSLGKNLTKTTGLFGGTISKIKSSKGFVEMGKIFSSNGAIGGKIWKMREALSKWKFDKIFELRGKLKNLGKMWKTGETGKAFSFLSESIKSTFSKGSGMMKGKFIGSIKNFITKFMGTFKKLPSFFKVGKIIGKVLLPVEMIIKAITGIFRGDTIRDKILGMSAGLLDPILMLPEMIGNGILWLGRKVFGEDFLGGFKFDFGMEAIITGVNNVTKAFEGIIHGFLDVIFHPIDTLKSGIDLITSWFTQKTEEIGMAWGEIKKSWEKFTLFEFVKEAAQNIADFFKDLIPGKEKIKEWGGKVKGFFSFGGEKEEKKSKDQQAKEEEGRRMQAERVRKTEEDRKKKEQQQLAKQMMEEQKRKAEESKKKREQATKLSVLDRQKLKMKEAGVKSLETKPVAGDSVNPKKKRYSSRSNFYQTTTTDEDGNKKTWNNIKGMSPEKNMEIRNRIKSKMDIPSRQIGGDIIKTGIVNLHKGERVLPAEVVDLPDSIKRGSDLSDLDRMKRTMVQMSVADKKSSEDVSRRIQEKQLKAIEKTETSTQQGNISVVNAISNMSGGGGERPIPDEIDNVITSLAVKGAY